MGEKKTVIHRITFCGRNMAETAETAVLPPPPAPSPTPPEREEPSVGTDDPVTPLATPDKPPRSRSPRPGRRIPHEEFDDLEWQAHDAFVSFKLPEPTEENMRLEALSWQARSVMGNQRSKLPPLGASIWRQLLPQGGAVLQHVEQPTSGDTNEVCGEPLISSEGEHRFTFTIIRGSGTGMRVGIASADGRQTWGFRIFDGRLQQWPPPPSERSRSDASSMAANGDENDGHTSSTERIWNRVPGQKIEVVVDVTHKRLMFNVGLNGGCALNVGIDLPPEGFRPWFESKLKLDAIAISSTRVALSHPGAPVARPAPCRISGACTAYG